MKKPHSWPVSEVPDLPGIALVLVAEASLVLLDSGCPKLRTPDSTWPPDSAALIHPRRNPDSAGLPQGEWIRDLELWPWFTSTNRSVAIRRTSIDDAKEKGGGAKKYEQWRFNEFYHLRVSNRGQRYPALLRYRTALFRLLGSCSTLKTHSCALLRKWEGR